MFKRYLLKKGNALDKISKKIKYKTEYALWSHLYALKLANSG